MTGSHRADIYLKHKFSKMADLIVRTNIGIGNGSVNSETSGETRNSNNQIENSSQRDQNSLGNNYKINSTITLRQKLAKVGRSIVAEMKLTDIIPVKY